MEPNTRLAVVRRYFEALSAKDFGSVADILADDIVWHQPGANRFSGTRRGGADVGEMIGAMMTVSAGTFELALTSAPMVNGALVAAPVHFTATRDAATMDLDGIDMMRVEDERIAEVWLFTSDQEAEDAFWGAG